MRTRWWWHTHWPEVAIVAAVVVLIVPLVVLGVVTARTEAACLRAGYPSATVDVFLNRYCVKRVDQTDVVVPLSDVAR
jgi:hypothetical protein